MTPLEAEIRSLIQQRGPLGVDEYMALCLAHPEHGYYMAREPFGRGGDFTTAPEVSQMFGEILGAWAADTWMRMGSPRVRLVELGPGRGTLMADALRVLAHVPGFLDAASLHLVETSPRLRKAQARTLREAPLAPCWHDAFEAVPDGPAIVLANELFDALPVQQWVRGETGWHQRVVTLAGGRLAFAVEGVAPPPTERTPHDFKLLVGTILETSPVRLAVARTLGRRVAEQGGAALIVDYGHRRSGGGDTLQAVRAHAYADPLQDPGLADLTSHVDFEAVGDAAREVGAEVHGPMEQGAFLRALGIDARAARLGRGAPEPQARAIDAALTRLTASHAMGGLFKVLAVAAPGLAPAPFFPAVQEIEHA